MRLKYAAFISAIFALMVVVGLLLTPDRAVQQAQQMISDGSLLALSKSERKSLQSYLDVLHDQLHLDRPFSINEPYSSKHINVYVVDSEGKRLLSRGNAAFANPSDILFIDQHYFRFGDKRIFENSEDEFTQQVLAPLRVHAYFVIAHEIGHRQLHNGFWRLPGVAYSHSRELEADDFSIQALKGIYSTPTLRIRANVPVPISVVTDFTDAPATPLQLLVDHLGYSISFLSQEVFDSPFPILSESETHPAFFERFHRLLQRLVNEATTSRDDPALQQLQLVLNVSSATLYLLSLRPTEIQFDQPFQYAYIDKQKLQVISNDSQPFISIPLSSLRQGQLVRYKASPPKHNATVAHAWSSSQTSAVVLRRESQRIEIVSTATGAVLSTRGLTTEEAGDDSCYKRFITPPQPSLYVYTISCIKQRPLVTMFGSSGEGKTIDLQELANKTGIASGIRSDAEPIRFAGFELGANGDPVLIAASRDRVVAANLTADLVVRSTQTLSIRPDQLPETFVRKGKALMRDFLVADGRNGFYFFNGSDISHRYKLFSATVVPPAVVMSVKSELTANDPPNPDPDPVADDDLLEPFRSMNLEDKLSRDTYLRETHQIRNNCLIANLEEGGVFLINFDRSIMAPLSRNEFANREQVFANAQGDWIIYQKFSKRILYFKGRES
jgi:hypothetical protein